MRILFAFLIVIIYWLLDSYQNVSTFDIPMIKAIFLDYPLSNPLIKILISVFIFVFMLIPNRNNNDKKEIIDNKKDACSSPIVINAIYDISDTILSPLPLHKQVNNVTSIIEKYLKAKTAFVGSYEKDSIFILNTNESLKKVGIKDKYLPHHSELNTKSLDALLSICYLEKRESVDDIVEINDVKYRAIIQSYKGKTLKKSIGITAILLEENDTNDYYNFLSKVCEQIAFTVNVTHKKDEIIKAQNNFNEQFSSMDTQLNIPSNTKVQEIIEHEIKRSQRYQTQLSLMLIEIDHMQNLSNIFNEKETIALKREIISILKKEVRETDLFGKWTGDHFAIVAPDIDFRATKYFADKINRVLKDHRFSKVGKITCSYGITSFSEKDSIGDFRKRAENALLEALRKGGNTIEVKILV